MIKLMCANLSLFCAYSSAPDEDGRVGVFIAGHPPTPDACYYEAEIADTGMDGSISIGLCSKRCPLDVHVGCATESVGLTLVDGRCVAVCKIWSCRLWEMKNCIRTKTQNYVRRPEIKSIIVLCVMAVIWLYYCVVCDGCNLTVLLCCVWWL